MTPYMKAKGKKISGMDRTILHATLGLLMFVLFTYAYGVANSSAGALAYCGFATIFVSIIIKAVETADYKAVLYAISVVLVCVWSTFVPVAAFAAIIALCIGDSAATLFGNGKNQKSERGSFACGFMTFMALLMPVGFMVAIVAGAVAMLVESASGDYDNFCVPFTVFAVVAALVV